MQVCFCVFKYAFIMILIEENDSIYLKVVFIDAIFYPSLSFLYNIFFASLPSILLKLYFPDSRI